MALGKTDGFSAVKDQRQGSALESLRSDSRLSKGECRHKGVKAQKLTLVEDFSCKSQESR